MIQLLAACAALSLVLWCVPPLRRWSSRWPLFFLLIFAGLLISCAVALSHTPVDLVLWSPMLMAGFALTVLCTAAFVVRAFEWYLWAYWR